jgi:hypothetical protein
VFDISQGPQYQCGPASIVGPQIPDDDCPAIGELPRGMQDLALAGRLPKETVAWLRVIPSDPAGVLEGTTAFAIRNNVLARLRLKYPGLLSPSDDCGPALERLLALTLIRLREHSSCYFLDYFFDSVTLELMDNVPLRKVPVDDGPERQGLLWIWLTLVDLWKNDEIHQREWLQRLTIAFPEVKCWSINEFECFGHRFLWRKELTEEIRKQWPLTVTTRRRHSEAAVKVS